MPSMKSCLFLLIGLGIGATGVSLIPRTSAEAPPAFLREEPAYRSLDANLYQQTSGEYRACCLQAYNLAERRLAEKLVQEKEFSKPPAVILDLDETVLDNSGFQAMLTRSGLGFDVRLWDMWQEKHADDVGLVPGAKEFLGFAKSKGVAIVYITNRDEKYRAGCKAVLERHGLSVPDEQLLLAGKTSDKTDRRKAVAEKFTVVMLVGDNLRDFDDTFRYEKGIEMQQLTEIAAAIASREKKVDESKAKFGAEWIILPNPVYGEWQKPFTRGLIDSEFLRPVRKQKK